MTFSPRSVKERRESPSRSGLGILVYSLAWTSGRRDAATRGGPLAFLDPERPGSLDVPERSFHRLGVPRGVREPHPPSSGLSICTVRNRRIWDLDHPVGLRIPSR